MVDIPDHRQGVSPESASDSAAAPLSAEAALAAGLAALQKRQFVGAIANLEGVPASARPSVRWKAQVALVKAYAGNGQWDGAIALCQSLTTAPNASVQTWATQWLQTHTPPAPKPADWEADLAANLTLRKPGRSPAPRSTPIPATSAPATSTPATSAPATPTPADLSATPSLGFPASSFPPGTEIGNIAWTMAGRAQQRSKLAQVDHARLWALGGLTVLGLGAVLRAIAQTLLNIYNAILNQSPLAMLRLGRWGFYRDPLFIIVVVLLLAFGLSFWGLRAWLRYGEQLQPLKLSTLERYSPEAKELLLQRSRRGKAYPAPGHLGYLPTHLPLAFTYGLWPGKSQLVLSQGLLDVLAEDEIAAIVAGELAHLRFWDVPFLSGLVGLAQLPYGLYWQAAKWGDRTPSPQFKALATVVSVAAYGLFWVIRLMGLWLSRLRLEYSDRAATELTGNPNALSRALLKLAMGTAHEIAATGATPPLLGRLDLLTPVGLQVAAHVGSRYSTQPGTALLEWDRQNRFQPLLVFRDSHPPLGDRLHRLHRYAQTYRLPTELNFAPLPSPKRPTLQEARPFLLQSLPWLGLVLGAVVGQGFWWFGAIADQMQWFSLDWFRNDFIVLVTSFVGFSLGTVLRFNDFFPDIKRLSTLPDASLPQLLEDSTALPGKPSIVKLQGQLLGRKGIGNAIAQDLWLKTPEGLIRLHFLPTLKTQLLPIAGGLQLQRFLNQPVVITGWFRRGSIPWVDLHSLHAQQGKALMAGHPIWSVILALALTSWCCYQIITGDI